MTSLKKVKLGDIAEITTGFPFKGSGYSNLGIRVVRGENVSLGQLRWDTIKCWNHPFSQVEKYSLNENDVVIGMDGSRVGRNKAQIKKNDLPLLLAQRVARVKARLGYSQTLIAYIIKSPLFEKYVEKVQTGTSIPHISQTQIEDFKFDIISDYKIQCSIAEILSSLDDKIELNNKINQELESLAQLLFKRWFVDFEFPNERGEPYKSSGGEMVDSELGEIPKGWKLDKLEKIVTKSHTGADAITRAPIVDYDTGIKCARVGDLTNKRSYLNWAFCKINPQDYDRHKLEEGDIIVTRTATLGVNQLVRKSIDAVCNNGLIRLKLDKKVYHPNFVFIQLQSDSYKEYIERISGDSSTRPNMQMDYLLDFKIILPESSLVIKFSELLDDIYNQIDASKLENEALANTRDTLLPKLISGELQTNEN